MTKERILITGINGLIGKILTPNLTNTYEIFGIDLQGPFNNHVFSCDISNWSQLYTICQKLPSINYIIHLAADSRVKADWESVLSANIIGTKNIYEVARIFKIKKVIFASSNHVTGAYEGLPPRLHLEPKPRKIKVTEPIAPDSDYGVSKAFGEALARFYYFQWGIESICLRIGHVLADDNPQGNPRSMKIWLSHRDLIDLILKSLSANIPFGIYYGVSNNKGMFWDISNARSEIGYNPPAN